MIVYAMRSSLALAVILLVACGGKEPELDELARKALSPIDGEVVLDGLSPPAPSIAW
jgi:hypothetical protein